MRRFSHTRKFYEASYLYMVCLLLEAHIICILPALIDACIVSVYSCTLPFPRLRKLIVRKGSARLATEIETSCGSAVALWFVRASEREKEREESS